MNSNKKYYILGILFTIVFSLVSYRVINQIGFDYSFHTARIVGLAQSIRNFNFLPNINFIFSYGTGYASPMFYGNWLLYIPAIIYVITKSTLLTYTVYGTLINVFTFTAAFYVYSDISGQKKRSFWLACVTPVFFPLYGFGMTAVVPLCILLIHALFLILIKGEKKVLYLGVVAALLIQTHLLSTFVLIIYFIVFSLFNLSSLNFKKIQNLLLSAAISISLSIGFLAQFLEQQFSQTFFYKWNTRDVPRKSSGMFNTKSIIKTISEQVDYGGFASITTPLFSLIVLSFAVFLLKTEIKNFTQLAKTLSIIVVSSIILVTDLFPWKRFQHTFLGSFQYPYRLIYFIPVIIIIVYLLSLSEKQIKYFSILSIAFFITSTLFVVQIDKEKQKSLNERFRSVYYGNTDVFINPVGNEYYTIDIDSNKVKENNFKSFDKLNNVTISNIEYSYNLIEFDYKIINEKLDSSIVVPRIWYKGYVAEYSNGGLGNQPKLETNSFSNKELENNEKMRRNFSNDKILNDGKIYLKFQNSGHVAIKYKKTHTQIIGITLEVISWIISCLIVVKRYDLMSKKKPFGL